MFRERIIDFIKGVIIGIANIMPGFSGGIMAVSFNVYDRIIGAVSNFFSHPFKTIKDVWAIALGGVVGIILAILGISVLLEHFPFPTIMLFTGLIVGSVPTIFEKVRAKHYKISQIIAFFLGILIIIGIPLLAQKRTVDVSQIDPLLLITLFFLGIVAAATMVVPGVSGSLILLAFGYYIYIVNFIKTFLKALITFNWEMILANFSLVFSLGLGMVIGVVALAKLVEKLLKKIPTLVYSTILGLICASPFAIIYQLLNPADPETEPYRRIIQENLLLNVLVGVLFLGIGVFLADFMAKYEKNHPPRKRETGEENGKNEKI